MCSAREEESYEVTDARYTKAWIDARGKTGDFQEMLPFLLLAGILASQDAPFRTFTGAWTYTHDKDKMTDEEQEWFSLNGSGDKNSRAATISIGCTGGRIKMAGLTLNQMLDSSPALIRLDDKKPFSADLHILGDHKGFFLNEQLIFILGSQKILFRLNTYPSGQVDLEFHPFDADRSRFSKACGVEGNRIYN